MEHKVIRFDIESAELIEKDPTSRFAWVKILAFSSGKNRHNLICDEDTLKRTAPTLYNTPVMYDIVNYTGDFGTHTDPGKSRIAGFVSPGSAEFVRLEDGRLSVQVLARIWKIYAPKVMEIFKRKSSKKVSVEMELIDHQENSDGTSQMLDFVYQGIQLLGDMVTEASPKANAMMLSFAEEKKIFDEAIMAERYEKIDFSIPEAVRANSSSAMRTYKQNEGRVTSSALAMGKYLELNDTINPEKVKIIFDYLSKNKKNVRKSLSYQMYGGDEAIEWCKDVLSKIEQEDNMVSFESSDISSEESEKKEENVEDEEVKKEEMTTQMEAPQEEPEKPEDEKHEEEESKEEEDKEEKEEETKEDMSLDMNLDVAAILSMLDDQTEDYSSLVEEHKMGSTNFAKLCNAMYQKMCNMKDQMCKMSEENQVYMQENKELKDFKASYESKEFKFAVEKILNEVSDVMPQEKIEEQREDSKNFSLDTIDAWENKTKAIAFSFAKKTNVKSDGVTRVALPFADASAKKETSIWKR